MIEIVLDTETTGICPASGHRIIEIGCVEIINRHITGETFHHYLNPERKIGGSALLVNGISSSLLANKPKFAEIACDLIQFIEGSELIIHNAPFDVSFLDHELAKINLGTQRINDVCSVLDTLKFARKKHLGKKNDLNSLCKRYEINNSDRKLHGALLDAKILASVYLAMTGGQVSFPLAMHNYKTYSSGDSKQGWTMRQQGKILRVIKASDIELVAHQNSLQRLQKFSNGKCVWLSER